RPSGDRPQSTHLALAQGTGRAPRQGPDLQWAVAVAMQRLDREPHGFAHTTHLPVAPLVDTDIERGSFTMGAREPDVGGTAANSGLEDDPRPHVLELTRVGDDVDQHLVAL